MRIERLFYFYTIWSFIIHILGKIYNFNTYELALVVFIGSIFLNIHYLRIYNFRQNIIRLPFEIIFHIMPLYYANKNFKESAFKSRVIILLMSILYLFIFTNEEIANLYNDPYKFLQI